LISFQPERKSSFTNRGLGLKNVCIESHPGSDVIEKMFPFLGLSLKLEIFAHDNKHVHIVWRFLGCYETSPDEDTFCLARRFRERENFPNSFPKPFPSWRGSCEAIQKLCFTDGMNSLWKISIGVNSGIVVFFTISNSLERLEVSFADFDIQ
jgi:hypothetical protein